MAVAQMRVPTIFTAVDKFSDVVSKMTNKTAHFSRSASSAINRVDHRLNNMWGSMNNISQLAIGGGVGGLFYYAGKDVMEYEKKIASLAAVTGTKIGSMNSQIQSLGKETKRSVIDIAGAFEIVGSKMSEYLDKPEQLKQITSASIMLANASRMELEPSIDALTQVMNIYKMKAEDASRIVNKLSAGETVGSVSIAQSSDILRQFGAQAVSTNVSIEESIALIQTLTKSLGVEGVGKNLRNILFDIASTKTWDKKRWKAIRSAGVDFEFLTDSTNSTIERLRELKKLAGVKGATELFFKRTGTIGAKTLFQNFDVFEDFLDKITKLNDAEAKAAKNASTLAYLIDRVKDSFTNFIVTGDNATGMLGVVKGLMGWMIDNMGTLVNLVLSTTVAFLGWKAIVTVVALINGVMTAFNAIMGVHRFIVLWATLTNVSYAASLWAVAAATLAAYWPLLLIAGALGVLVYSLWDTKDATDAMALSQVTAIDKTGKAWKTSTNVMTSELSKQQEANKKHLDSLEKNSEKYKTTMAMMNQSPSVLSQAEMLTKVAEYQEVQESMNKPVYQNIEKVNRVFANTSKGVNKNTVSTNTPSNLAGSGSFDKEFIKNMIAGNKSGKLEIYLRTDGGVNANVGGDIPPGVEVKTTPNQGSRGNWWEYKQPF